MGISDTFIKSALHSAHYLVVLPVAVGIPAVLFTRLVGTSNVLTVLRTGFTSIGMSCYTTG